MGQKSKNVFYINPIYKNFIPGRSRLKRPDFGFDKMRLTDWGCLIFFVPLWWFTIFLMLWTLLPIPFDLKRFGMPYQLTFEWWTGLVMYIMFSGVTLYMIYIGDIPLYLSLKDVIGFWRYRKLRREGNLIMGEIVEISREEKRGFHGAHNVIVTYQFETPDGRLLTRTMKKERHDLRNKELLGKGTAVMVLYADDSAVMML